MAIDDQRSFVCGVSKGTKGIHEARQGVELGSFNVADGELIRFAAINETDRGGVIAFSEGVERACRDFKFVRIWKHGSKISGPARSWQ